MAGELAERWNGAAAATQIDAVAIAATTTNFLFKQDLRMVRRSILPRRSPRVSYRVTVRAPNPILSDKRNEGMLFVLLVPFDNPFRSWMPKV